MVAPAGFGKTELLAEWISRIDVPVAWLSLDGGDNDPVRFWRHVAHSLDRAGADVAARVEPLLAASGPAFDRVVTAIVNGLAAESTGLVLVLDDYHLIEAEFVHDTLQMLVENLPAEVQVVVAGRSDPPIPLARRRAAGRLAELRVTDLRFTAEEAAGLLRGLVGPTTVLPDEAVATLATRTEGWAVGLQLAALSLQGSTDVAGMVASFSGSHRYILDYLTEEVLAHQSAGMQEFLLETSVLGRLSGPLCAAVTGRADAQEMLENIERANLFLVPLDAERGWWRYHHLFGDLLYARMRQQRPERVLELHRRAASWLQEHGLIDDAIRHALSAGDAESAARLVERHADEYLNSSEDATLERWLQVLPAEAVAAQPRLLVTKARLAVMSGRVAEGGELLDVAERAYPDAADVPYESSVGQSAGPLANVPAIIAVNRAFIANLQGDPDTASEFATRALGALGEDEWMLDALARAHLAMAGWSRGNSGEAERAIVPIIDRWLARGALDYATLWSFILGRIQCAQGRLSAAAATYERALTLDGTTDSAQRPAAGAVLVVAAEVAYQRNDLDTAERHLEAALPLCRELGYTQPLAIGLALRALIRDVRGDVLGADAGMAEAVAASPPAVVELHNPVPAMQARLWLRRGDVVAAARWATERGLDADDEPVYVHEPAYLVLAGILIRQNRPADALRLLDRLHTAAAEHDRHGSIIEIQALRSIALAGQDDDGALAALSEALELAQPGGYVRVFADERQPMATVLGRFAASGRASAAVPPDYLGRLMEVLGVRVRGAPGPDAGFSGSVVPLSGRELEVLRLLAVGRANREIAGELFISPHTVKRHVAHILDKLRASNRTEAGARARELGLLS